MDEFDLIKNTLGQPYFENGSILLYNMDSIEALSYLKGKVFFDQTITSPPYNIGKEYEKIKPINEYVNWSENWFKKVYDVTSDNGSFWLNIGYAPIKGKGKAIPLAYLLWDKTNFYFIQEIVWHYGAGVAARKSLSPRNEKVLWFVKNSKSYTFNLDSIRDPNVKYPNQKKNGKLKVNPLGKNPSDVWDIPKVTSGKKRHSVERVNHPAQTPIELFKRIILAGSNENELILDPFVGSGTTCIAAKATNRRSVGFDINKQYLDIAVERINKEHVEEQALFNF